MPTKKKVKRAATVVAKVLKKVGQKKAKKKKVAKERVVSGADIPSLAEFERAQKVRKKVRKKVRAAAKKRKARSKKGAMPKDITSSRG